jgi:serine/threonine protein kinase
MASVWLAGDSRLGREVAIKVLADSLALDAGFVSRFEREALVAARVSHPNLVNVFDFSSAGPRPYLVMEYVQGGTLADRLRGLARSDWDPETVFRELMAALAHVHAAGIVHRDIKPGNVLIGQDGRTRLTDFGIARPSDGDRLTSTGLVIGTARYIAPEILSGRPADERSDLYACGVLLRDCLHANGAPRLRSLADRLMQERPELRPASAGEVLELLDRQSTARTAVLPKATVFRARGIQLRAPRAMVLAACLLLLVIAFITLASGGSGGSRSPSQPTLGTPPPAAAPLGAQLRYLDGAIARARR